MGQFRINVAELLGRHLYSRVRCNEDPQSPARKDAFDLLECQFVLSLLAELLDSLNAVANVLLIVSCGNTMFERPD
jgi:hypothetical protein